MRVDAVIIVMYDVRYEASAVDVRFYLHVRLCAACVYNRERSGATSADGASTATTN